MSRLTVSLREEISMLARCAPALLALLLAGCQNFPEESAPVAKSTPATPSSAPETSPAKRERPHFPCLDAPRFDLMFDIGPSIAVGDEEKLQRICDTAERLGENSAKYYSYWFEQAYKNKIHRQQYLKSIMNNSRISMSNLLLAQILNIKTIATTAITPNFDNHLLKSLNLLGNYDVFSANNMLDNIALNANSKTVQIMHVH